jgi:hypothetical protein
MYSQTKCKNKKWRIPSFSLLTIPISIVYSFVVVFMDMPCFSVNLDEIVRVIGNRKSNFTKHPLNQLIIHSIRCESEQCDLCVGEIRHIFTQEIHFSVLVLEYILVVKSSGQPRSFTQPSSNVIESSSPLFCPQGNNLFCSKH